MVGDVYSAAKAQAMTAATYTGDDDVIDSQVRRFAGWACGSGVSQGGESAQVVEADTACSLHDHKTTPWLLPLPTLPALPLQEYRDYKS